MLKNKAGKYDTTKFNYLNNFRTMQIFLQIVKFIVPYQIT